MVDYLLKLLESDVRNFENTILREYCLQKNLPHQISSLFVREEIENFPDSINILLANKVPKYLLYNSKSFLKWYKTLDKDFKREVVRDEVEMKRIKSTTYENELLKNFIKKKLGIDSDVY